MCGLCGWWVSPVGPLLECLRRQSRPPSKLEGGSSDPEVRSVVSESPEFANLGIPPFDLRGFRCAGVALSPAYAGSSDTRIPVPRRHRLNAGHSRTGNRHPLARRSGCADVVTPRMPIQRLKSFRVLEAECQQEALNDGTT